MTLIVFQRFFILTRNLQVSQVTLFTRKWRSHMTLGFEAWGQICSDRCKLQELGIRKICHFVKHIIKE
jgi:hypothetical protein